ncbi:tRNA pseudouridine55 synthase [Lachnospiraceae bacterium NK3A20]|nr:tRNA pseudouridine55 synthase [Lachnospiraceae bacterium NK3A20]
MPDGMITVRKVAGYTSSDVVAKLRGILHMKKIGHTGTLDPAAEGVLPVCLGNATKLCDLIADHDKEYEAVLRLGVTTNTQDMTGEILSAMEPSGVREQLEAAAAQEGSSVAEYIAAAASRFTGEIEQTPPKFSAVWINGKRAYDLARKGVDFEMPKRRVTIERLTITDITLPFVTFRVTCSKGTYIRTLCEDIGRALGVGGAMEHLIRTRVGIFTLDRALTLNELDILAHWQPEKITSDYLYPVDSFFESAPKLYVNAESQPYLDNGNPLSFANMEDHEDSLVRDERVRVFRNETKTPGSPVRVYNKEGEFYGIYRYDFTRKRLLCIRMFHEVAGARNNR